MTEISALLNTNVIPTAEQELINTWFAEGVGNLIVVARAGTGKTTTAVNAVRFAPERRIKFTCFNTRIAKEGNAKLHSLGITNAEFKTIHSIGAAAVYKFWENVKVGENFER